MKTSISFGDFQAMIDDAHRGVSMGSRAEAEACPTAWPPRSIMVGRTGNLGGIFPGWWLSHPSEKYDFVSWHDDIPHIWKIKFMFQTTNQFHMNGGGIHPVLWCSIWKFPNDQNPKWHWFFWRNLDFLTDIQKCRRRLAYDKILRGDLTMALTVENSHTPRTLQHATETDWVTPKIQGNQLLGTWGCSSTYKRIYKHNYRGYIYFYILTYGSCYRS